MPGVYQYDVEIKSNVAKLLSDMKQAQDRLDTVEGKEYKIKLNVDEKKLSSAISNLEKMLDSLDKGMGNFKQLDNLSKEIENIKDSVAELQNGFHTLSIDNSSINNFIGELMDDMTDLTVKVEQSVDKIKNASEDLNIGNNIADSKSFERIIDLFSKMESSLSSIKGVLVDVGDGEELSPLLSEINNIQTAIGGLSSSLNNLHFNMNIDMGTDNQMDAKIQEKAAKALNAYEKLFNGLKMSGYGGEVVNNKFFDFDINKFDTTIGKVKAYKDIIERLRKEAKEYYSGADLLRTQTDDKLWRSASSAGGQLTQAINETAKSKADNPLENLFGKTDLSGVIEQLNTIVSKLDEISVSAKGFTETFKNGLNVNTSVEEIEKLTNRVKELETELARIKTPTAVTPSQESNILSASTPAIEQQNKLQEELKETQIQVEETKSSLNDLSNVKGLKHYTDEVFDKFDNNMFGSGIGENRLGEAAYFFDEKNSGDWSGIGEYSKYLTTWSANQVKLFDQTFGFTEEQINQIIKEFYSDVDEDIQEDYKFDLKNIMDDDLYDFKSKFGIELQDVMKSLGYDAIKTNSGEYAFYNTDKLVREVQVYDQEANKIIDINNKVAESIKETPSEPTKDAFPSTDTKLDEAVTSAKDLNKTLEQVDIPTDSFDKVLEKLDRTKSELVDIVKITKQSVSDIDGKFHDSYTLKDSRGSTEIYGMNSKTDKGQILRQNIVGYDTNTQTRQEQQEAKRIIEENIRLNKNYYDSKTKDEAEYQKLRGKYIAEGLRQEQQVYQEYNKSWEEAIQYNNSLDNSLKNTGSTLNSLSTPKTLEKDFLKLIDDSSTLEHQLRNCEITLKEYNSLINSKVGEYNKKVNIQQKRDVEEYDSNSKTDNAKKLEREKQIWNELTTSLDRYATLQKRIASNNALSTDNEEATKLLEHIHELQRNDILPTEKLTASNEKLQQINQTVTDLKAKLKESTLDSLQGSIDKYQKIYNQRSTYSSDFTPSEQYTKNLTELNTAIKNLVEYRNALKNVGEVTVEQEAHLKGLVATCEKASDSFRSLSASEKGASQIAVDKLVQRINKDLDECTNYSKEAKLGLRALRDELESANPRNLKEITSEIINIENAEIKAGRAGRSFFDTLKNSGFHQLAAQMAGMFGFYDVINLGKQAISAIVDLDDALLDLKKTTSMSSTELNNFYYSANDVAKQMGVTTKSIIEQASAWSRLGYSSNEQATEMAKLSSKFASISPGMDTDQAQEGMVSIMKAWQINPEDVEKEILDPINQLGNKFAESNDDIVEGMKRSAAALAAVGTDYKDAYSLFTGIQEVLQNSEVAGRALRSISMRIRGYDENSEDGFEQTDEKLKNITGDLIDLTKTAEHSQGVSVFKEGSTTEFKSLVDYFGEIHDIWDEMSQKQQNDFLQKAFGKTQAQAGSALIQNYDAVKEALAEIDESAGSADKEMSTVEQTLSYKINALKETWVGCAQQILDRGDLGIAISGLNGVSKVITGLIDNVGLLKTAAMGVAAAFSFKNVGRDKLYSLSF